MTTRDNTIIYLIIGGGTIGLIAVIAWLLGAFNTSTELIIPNIRTNNIIQQTATLPESCQKATSLMNCIISSNNSTGENTILNESYIQLISERNIITDQVRLESACSTQYNYLLNIKDEPYLTTIKSCLR